MGSMGYLLNGKLNFNLLCDYYCWEFLECLDKCLGLKVLLFILCIVILLYILRIGWVF